MSDHDRTAPRRLVLVDDVEHAGTVLEHALAARGWTVTRAVSASTIAPHGTCAFDAVLLALDGEDADVFELLLWLSSLPDRPPVVVFTRRADARVLGREVLASLGIDRVLQWPARIEQIEVALDAARRAHQPERLVS